MSEMTDARAAEVLAAHNKWRRYNGETGVPDAPEMGDPAEIGRAIDHVVSRLLAQPPAEAQAQGGGEAMAWQHPDTLPPVEPGQYGWFWVAVRRANSGHVYSFPATYLNAMVLTDENCDQEESQGNRYHHGPADEDDGEFEATGWHDAKEHSEYSAIYLPLLDSDKDELIAWRAVADYGDTTPPSAPVGVEVSSLPALWRQREPDNGEEHTEFDKGYEQASDECAEALERALTQQGCS